MASSEQETIDKEYLINNCKILSQEEIAKAFSIPELIPTMVSLFAKMDDEQMEHAAPFLNSDQIKQTIPKLQLQQTGVCVQVMSPDQIRQSVAALTNEDRTILNSNIALLSSTTSKDELQSFLAFIEPLALCMTVKNKHLCKRVLQSAPVMTAEQIRVIVPFLDCQQLQQLFVDLQDETHIDVAISMIDKKEDLINLLFDDAPKLEKQNSEVRPKIEALKQTFCELSTRVNDLADGCDIHGDYESLCSQVKQTKAQIESIQQTIRQNLCMVVLPLKLLQDKPGRDRFVEIEKESKILGRSAHEAFIAIDKIISDLNVQWNRIQPQLSINEPPNSPASSIFEDEESAIMLFEAVKEIGNPAAVGNIYSMTWTQIIQAGFKTSADFKARGITTLEELQRHLDGSEMASQ